MITKIKSKSKVRIEGTIQNKSCSTTCETVIKTYPDPKNQKDPKIKSKSKVRIEGTIEYKSCSTTWGDPKTVFEPYSDPKK